ncbi:hypothetical protein GCM10010330_76410 [Streptomyces tendae]|uniref:hypothetical protein n=1 Tax=Streptomyces tendae TaxID=1932 RepID=UPI00167AD575|nr:hypothetical protein [Streptomyces tendae]GHB11166.1 hypothetical protein GCM10010330_76410 [Streptomyces tendae]
MVTESSWLVGFDFRTASGRVVHHFYVVSGTFDPELARDMALERADAPGERAARGGLRVDGDHADTRQLVSDLLGVRHLSAPSRI